MVFYFQRANRREVLLILYKYRTFFSTPFTERFWRLFRARLLLRSVFFFEFLFLLFFYIYVILYNISLPNRTPQALLSTKKLKQSVLFFSSSTSSASPSLICIFCGFFGKTKARIRFGCGLSSFCHIIARNRERSLPLLLFPSSQESSA